MAVDIMLAALTIPLVAVVWLAAVFVSWWPWNVLAALIAGVTAWLVGQRMERKQ